MGTTSKASTDAEPLRDDAIGCRMIRMGEKCEENAIIRAIRAARRAQEEGHFGRARKRLPCRLVAFVPRAWYVKWQLSTAAITAIMNISSREQTGASEQKEDPRRSESVVLLVGARAGFGLGARFFRAGLLGAGLLSAGLLSAGLLLLLLLLFRFGVILLLLRRGLERRVDVFVVGGLVVGSSAGLVGRHDTSESGLLLLLLADLLCSVELSLSVVLVESTVLGAAHDAGVGVAAVDVVPGVEEGEQASEEDDDDANTPNDLSGGGGRILVQDGDTEGESEQEGHDEIDDEVYLIEVGADDDGNDGVEDVYGDDGEHLRVHVLALSGGGCGDESEQERDGELLDEHDEVEARLLVVEDGVEGSEAELQEEEQKFLALVPDHDGVEHDGKDAEHDDGNDGSGNRAHVGACALADVPGSGEVDGHVTDQNESREDVEDLLAQQRGNEGLLLAQAQPHDERVDGVDEQDGAHEHGEPEHGAVEDVFRRHLHRVRVLLRIQQRARASHASSRARDALRTGGRLLVARQTVGVARLVVLVAVGQGQHEVSPVEVARELHDLRGERHVDERVERDELEKFEHLPRLGRTLVARVGLLHEVSREQRGVYQDGGSHVIDGHGTEDAYKQHEEEDDDHDNGSDQQTDLVASTGVPRSAGTDVRAVKVTSNALLGICAPTASAELLNARLFSCELWASQKRRLLASYTSPQGVASASERASIANSVSEAVGGALALCAVRGEGPVRLANAVS